ncbi:MAG: hypothetical protein HY775_11840 [Acidobacteria bacterium]|nr:hypothetical protein [Acidobacteriota bacterium]
MGRKRFTATATLLATVAALLLGSAVSASATTSQESFFIEKINQERTSRGLAALKVRSDLVDVAHRWSGQMAAGGDISHNPNLAKQVKGNWTVLGENVGMGANADSLHEAFMNSEGHRDNILGRDYNEVGVGVVVTEDGTIFVTEVFAHRSASSPKPAARKPAPAARRHTSRPASRPAHRAEPPSPAPVSAPGADRREPARAAGETPRNVEVLVQLVDLDGGFGR